MPPDLRGIVTVGARRRSALPELLAFFGDQAVLLRFFATFAGTSFNMPGPKDLDAFKRDMVVAEMIDEAMTVERRIEICTTARVAYSRLREVYQAVTGKVLGCPGSARRSELMVEYARAQRQHPAHQALLAEIYELKPAERRKSK